MYTTRWYDKDKFSKIIVDILEMLDDEVRVEIASDLIQIIIQERYIECSDQFIERVDTKCLTGGNRWYDKNSTLSSAIELLKYIDISKKSSLLSEFLCSLMSIKKTKVIDRNLELVNEYISRN